MPAHSSPTHHVSASTWGMAKHDLLPVLQQAFGRVREQAHGARAVGAGPLPRVEVVLRLVQKGWPAWSRPACFCDLNRPDGGWPALRRLLWRELDDLPTPYRGSLVIRLGVEDVTEHAEVVVDCVVANAHDDAVAHRPLRRELLMERRYRRLLERVVGLQTEAMTDMFGASSSVISASADVIAAGTHLRAPQPPRTVPSEGLVEQAAGAISRLVLAYKGGGAAPTEVDAEAEDPQEQPATAELGWVETRTWSAVAKVGGGADEVVHEVVLVRHPDAYVVMAQLDGVTEHLDTMSVEPSRQYGRDLALREWVRDVLEARLLGREQGFDSWKSLFDEDQRELELEWRDDKIYAWSAPVRSHAVQKQFTARLLWLPGRWQVWVDRDRPSPVPRASRPGQETPPRGVPQQVLAWALEEVRKRGVEPV